MTWTRRLYRRLRRSAGRWPPASLVVSVSAAGSVNNRVLFRAAASRFPRTRLQRWTRRSRRSWRRRRRSSGKSLKFVSFFIRNHDTVHNVTSGTGWGIFGDRLSCARQKKANCCCERARFLNLCQYEGEIRVLYQVTVVPTLTNKKWASKELAVKAGEQVDVIAKATDNRLLCRSEEGKCE